MELDFQTDIAALSDTFCCFNQWHSFSGTIRIQLTPFRPDSLLGTDVVGLLLLRAGCAACQAINRAKALKTEILLYINAIKSWQCTGKYHLKHKSAKTVESIHTGGIGAVLKILTRGSLTFSLEAERGGRQTGEKNFVLCPSGVFVGVSFT